MKTVGIIAEFNPFHNGHRYLIEEARRLTGAENVVVAMSGDFVQRGTPAVFDKHLRARMALENGADAVFELPAVWAAASAEFFAEAGIKLLNTLGCVDYVAFGAENADIKALTEIADILSDEPGDFSEALKAGLKSGLSFPAARRNALFVYTGNETLCSLADSPNNILAIEYLKALKRLNSAPSQASHSISPIVIQRTGSTYSCSVPEGPSAASATALRKLLQDGKTDSVSEFVPDNVYGLLKTAFPVFEDSLSDMLYIRLNTLTPSELAALADGSEDFVNTLLKYKNEPCTFTGLITMLKTKNLNYSTISRALLHIVLNQDSTLRRSLKSMDTLPYARLLGFKSASSHILRTVSDRLGGRFITKLANADRSEPLLKADIDASALYSQLVFTGTGRAVPSEFEIGPVRL